MLAKDVIKYGVMTVMNHRNMVIFRYFDAALDDSLGCVSKEVMYETVTGVRHFCTMMTKDVKIGPTEFAQMITKQPTTMKTMRKSIVVTLCTNFCYVCMFL